MPPNRRWHGHRPRPQTPQEASVDAFGSLLQAKNVAFFLDYDGTISEVKRIPEDAVPDSEIDALFARLQAPKNVAVYLASGRKREDMDQWFSRYAFNLIAEHGYYYKHHNAD